MLELTSILVLGIFAQWLAWKIKQPAILPLILIGLAIGPFATFFTPDSSKLIDGDNIFTGDLLFSFVSLAVGVILFEGGLTLNLKEIRNHAGTVSNLLTIGALITFVGGGIAAHILLDMSWPMAFLFGGLIVVSGPTVVLPILRNVKPNHKVNTILKWEGILIDPFGALIAVLMYEFIVSSQHGSEYPIEVFQNFFITISSGIVAGGLSALLLYYLIKNELLPSYLRNVFTLGLVIFTFAFAEIISKEAGLMAATFMGILLANLNLDEIKKILSFKEDISVILISVLFILLSSRIDLIQIEKLGTASLILFAIVVFILRPVGVMLSTIKSGLSWKEKVFISWIGPKGIVAAAVASLFSLDLVKKASNVSTEEAELILPLVFLIIVGTVVLQGSTAKLVARWLGVVRPDPHGILIVGANELARRIALKLQEWGAYVILIDTSQPNIKEAKKQNLLAFQGNVLSDTIFEEVDLSKIGKLAAMTSNSGLNELACRWFEKELNEEQVMRLASKEESENSNLPLPKNVLFKTRTDFFALTHLIRTKDVFAIEEFEQGQTEFDEFYEAKKKKIIPIAIVKKDYVNLINSGLIHIEKGDKLLFVKQKNFESELDKTEAV